MPEEITLQLKDIRKTFHVGIQDVEVLKGISFEVYKSDFLLIFGPSGCGKSTLLHTLLGLEPPTSGSVMYFGKELYGGSTEDERSGFRKKSIGMVYQQANWIRSLNVRENVAFPLTLLGYSKHEAFSEARKVLTSLNLVGWSESVPTELSGGQQQRVALARALINDPPIIVADEPTGNLDFKSGQDVMELLASLNKTMGKTVIMVTHDLEYLKYATRIVKIFDGTVEGIYSGEEKDKVMASVTLKRAAGGFSDSSSNSVSSSVPSPLQAPSSRVSQTPQVPVTAEPAPVPEVSTP